MIKKVQEDCTKAYRRMPFKSRKAKKILKVKNANALAEVHATEEKMAAFKLPLASNDHSLLCLAIVAAFVTRVVIIFLGRRIVSDNRPITISHANGAKFHAKIAVLTPILTPHVFCVATTA